jgi:hypothetical protein
MEPQRGFEPRPSRLRGGRSGQLSYRGVAGTPGFEPGYSWVRARRVCQFPHVRSWCARRQGLEPRSTRRIKSPVHHQSCLRRLEQTTVSGWQCRDSRTRTCDFAAPDRAPCQSGPYPVAWRRRESNPLRQRLQGAPAPLAVIPMSSGCPGRPKQGRPGTPEPRAAWRAAPMFPAVELSSSEHIPPEGWYSAGAAGLEPATRSFGGCRSGR